MNDVSPMLIGFALSGYALTQMLFVAPFGHLSDKIGRKNVILLGTLIFVIGSYVCYISDDIYTLILGRLLQGAGAVSAVISALVSDLIKEEDRTKAMALIGGAIAMGFTISMFVGPSIYSSYGIGALFFIAMSLGIVSIFVVVFKVPNPPKVVHTYNKKANIKNILKNKSLIIMNITNFLQKFIMTFTFVLVPIYLLHKFGWEKSELWMVYVPATILGLFAMGPASIIADSASSHDIVFIFIKSINVLSRSKTIAFIIITTYYSKIK